MRTQLEILKGLRDQNNPDYNLAFFEVIMDIRDALQPKEEVKEKCTHIGKSIVASTKCLQCGEIDYKKDTPPIPEKTGIPHSDEKLPELPVLFDEYSRMIPEAKKINSLISFLKFYEPYIKKLIK